MKRKERVQIPAALLMMLAAAFTVHTQSDKPVGTSSDGSDARPPLTQADLRIVRRANRRGEDNLGAHSSRSQCSE